jgi:hypothetical protein
MQGDLLELLAVHWGNSARFQKHWMEVLHYLHLHGCDNDCVCTLLVPQGTL